MASEVFSTEVITLLDGEEVELRPLPITKLRKFMRIWSDHIEGVTKELAKPDDERELTEADLTDKQFDVYVKMCALGLESQLKEERTEKQYVAHLEDVLDEQTIYKVLQVTGGLNVGGSPNLSPALSPELDGMN